MANTFDHALFYNSDNGDRIYDADSFSEWLRKFFTNGVFQGDLQVSAKNGMQISVAPGYVNIGGKVRIFTTISTFTVENANPSYDRIDVVVVERNDTDRDITLKIVTGNASLNPVAPVMVRANGIYQLCLAQITVRKGITEITQAAITDTRMNSSICGIVATAVDTLETSQYFAQLQDMIDRYNDMLNSAITGTTAGLLESKIKNLTKSVSLTISASGWSASTTTVNGGKYYVQVKTVQKIYDQNPTILINGEPLPTEAQQSAYDQLSYAVADANSKTITFYASEKPNADISLIVKGAE